MIQYILKRLLQSVIVLFFLSIIIFMLIQLMPGDVVTQFLLENPGAKPTEKEIQRYKEFHGLDKPLIIQYFLSMFRLVQGEFGRSKNYQIEISQLIPARILTTLKLTIPVIMLSLLVAIPIGIFTAVYQYSRFDYFVNILVFLGISLPTFWIGLVGIYIFSLKLQILPSSGIQTINVDSILDQLKYFILPVFVLSIHGTGSWVRYMRGSFLEILNLEYIRTAKAKGLSEEIVIFKHAFRNALIPLITILTLSLPFLVSGALITEQIFSIPGMGQLLYHSIIEKDRDMALVSFLILALLTLLFNIIADIFYSIIDPRIKLSKY